jgi:hypothetical protein
MVKPTEDHGAIWRLRDAWPKSRNLQSAAPKARKNKRNAFTYLCRGIFTSFCCTQQFGGTMLTDAVGIVPTPVAASSIATSSTSKLKIATS